MQQDKNNYLQTAGSYNYLSGYSGFDDKGKWQSRFLAPVKIKCPPQQLLQGFKFEHIKQDDVPMTYLFQFKYICTDSNIKDFKTETKKNEWTSWGHHSSIEEGSINFLVTIFNIFLFNISNT